MISKRFLVGKLRALGFTFVEQKKRIDLWRNSKGPVYVSIPRRDQLDDLYVRSTRMTAPICWAWPLHRDFGVLDSRSEVLLDFGPCGEIFADGVADVL